MKIVYILDDSWGIKRQENGVGLWCVSLIDYLSKKTKSIVISNIDWNKRKNEIVRFDPNIFAVFSGGTLNNSYVNLFKEIKKDFIKSHLLFFGDDMFHFKSWKIHSQPPIQYVDGIIFLTKMTYYMDKYQKFFPNKYIGGLDLFINDKLFNKKNIEKTHDIIIYGSLYTMWPIHPEDDERYIQKLKNNNKPIPKSDYFYPFRRRIADLLLNNKSKYKIKYIQRLPSAENVCKIRGENLSNEIASCYLALATTSRKEKCMIKYGEIVGSHTMVIGNIPTNFESIYKGNMLELNEEMTDQEILNKIDLYLSDKKLITSITNKFSEHMINTYGYNGNIIYDQFITHCNNVIKK